MLPPPLPLTALKVAVTDAAAFNVTVQLAPAPEHAPDQAVNADDAVGDALNTTDVPEAYP